MSFYLTNKAKNDLRNIAHYTETEWGKKQRNIYLKMIDDAFHDLEKMPEKGRKCDEIRKGYRKQIIGKHIIFYRILLSNQIEIVRILHSNRDILSQFRSN